MRNEIEKPTEAETDKKWIQLPCIVKKDAYIIGEGYATYPYTTRISHIEAFSPTNEDGITEVTLCSKHRGYANILIKMQADDLQRKLNVEPIV